MRVLQWIFCAESITLLDCVLLQFYFTLNTADMNYIKRNLENVVSQVTKEYPVVLVTGPRQVGKTTMLQ